MEDIKQEGRLSLRFDLPARLKAEFEEICRVQKKTMTEVVINLIDDYVQKNY